LRVGRNTPLEAGFRIQDDSASKKIARKSSPESVKQPDFCLFSHSILQLLNSCNS
jgi:hypothetical protein